MNHTLKQEKKFAIKAAKELCYSDKCINLIRSAKTIREISRILKTERLKEA